jgi:hypothetical protein
MTLKDTFEEELGIALEGGASYSDAESFAYKAMTAHAQAAVAASEKNRLRAEWENHVEMAYDTMPQWWWDKAARDRAFAAFYERNA